MVLRQVLVDAEDVVAVGRDVAHAARQVEARHAQRAVLVEAVLDLRVQAGEVTAQDDVHHARDRLRAVDRRGAVLEDVDAVDRRDRDRVHAGQHFLEAGDAVGRDAPAVDQHQRRAAAQATQRDRRRTRREAAELDAAQATLHDGQLGDDVAERRGARTHHILARDHRDGRRGLHVGALDVGTGDLDALQLLGLLLRLLLGQCRQMRAGGAQGQDGQPDSVGLEHLMDPPSRAADGPVLWLLLAPLPDHGARAEPA